MLGIITRWRNHDCTLAALAAAHRLDDLARRYSIFCYDWRTDRVDPAYDSHVHRRPFQYWLSKVNHIIWTAPVDEFFIDAARRRGISNTLYTSWDQLEPYDEKVLGNYTHVLVPSLIQAIQLRDKFRLRNVAILPYDTGLPHTVRCGESRISSRCRIFLSLYGTQLRRVDLSAILMLANIIRDFPGVTATVACSKGLTAYTYRELKALVKQYPDRWRILWDSPWHEQAVLMGVHDLTVIPAKWDGFGTVATTSLTMGTPVIAWDITPMSEFVSSGRNGLLVSSPVEYNWLGMATVKPDYGEFDRVLRWLLDQPDALNELKQHTLEHLEERRQDFRKGWDAVLPATM